MSDRYEGKEFLRLLDAYVLDTIGHLDQANQDWLRASEPYFRATYGEGETWRAIVANRMKFPPGMDAAICEVWDKGRVKFLQDTGEQPNAIQFAVMFVDKHFPH